MIEGREVTTATCDGCGRVQYHEVADDIQGYQGTIMVLHNDGGRSVSWFACRRRCIAKASSSVLDQPPGERLP